jgi:hypothetical protein
MELSDVGKEGRGSTTSYLVTQRRDKMLMGRVSVVFVRDKRYRDGGHYCLLAEEGMLVVECHKKGRSKEALWVMVQIGCAMNEVNVAEPTVRIYKDGAQLGDEGVSVSTDITIDDLAASIDVVHHDD